MMAMTSYRSQKELAFASSFSFFKFSLDFLLNNFIIWIVIWVKGEFYAKIQSIPRSISKCYNSWL